MDVVSCRYGLAALVRLAAIRRREVEDVGVGAVASASVEGGDGGHVVDGELEIKDVVIWRIRVGLFDFGITIVPSCKCQRITTCPTDLPCVRAISASSGSARTLIA